MKIVLYQPQIPQNTGNIVRTCAVTGCSLMLVRPLGFSVLSRWLKRAGLDYWEGVDVQIIEEEEFQAMLQKTENRFYFFSSKARRSYTDVSYNEADLLVFGSETAGLPQSFSEQWPESFVSLPMVPQARCLNLATSVGIAVYEARRQIGFPQFAPNE
jgi:tRNA (cytidine/uridine-2'-O-)-methyltransferase